MSTFGCEPEVVSGSGNAELLSVQQSRTSQEGAGFQPSSVLVWVMRSLCLIALSVSGYLAWTALNMQEVYGCGSGAVFDCGHVLTSQWSKIFGIPVSVPAVALWGSLLAALVFVRTNVAKTFSSAIWSTVSLGAFSAGLAALWFIGIQVFVLEHLCVYCLVAHTCGLVMAGLMIWKHPTGVARTVTMLAPAFAGFLVLAIGQYLTPPPQTYVVERFETEDAEVAVAGDTTADSDSDTGTFIDAPGEFFAPPGEFFAPPSGAVPSDDSATDSSNGVSSSETTSPADSAVAASLLTIHPMRWISRLATMHLIAQDAAADEDVSSDKTAADKEESQPAPKEVEPRLVSVQGRKFVLNTRQWPLIGDPDAKYIFVEMLDYTCPHCRATHTAVKGACRKFGSDLAVVVLPVPLNRACNKYASGSGHAGACELGTLAVAVWRIAPEKFGQYHGWLMEGGRSRTPSEAKRRAEQVVGAQALKAEMDKRVAAEYIKRHVDLYRRVGSGSVPKLMFPNATMTGEVRSITTLCNRIERELASR